MGAARPRLASRYAQLADEADVALLEHFPHSTGVVRHDLVDGFILRTGLEDNSKNGVVCSQLPGHADISRVLATLADVPARWYLSSVTEPSDLRARLEREGCRGERTAVHMAAELDGIDSGVSPDVVEVHDADDLVHVDSGEARLLVAAGPPLRHFAIGRTACVTTFTTGRTLLGVNLWVDRAHRRLGLARTLVRHAVAVGRGDGCTHAILAPTSATVPFFERLGFVLEQSRPDHWYYLPYRGVHL